MHRLWAATGPSARQWHSVRTPTRRETGASPPGTARGRRWRCWPPTWRGCGCCRRAACRRRRGPSRVRKPNGRRWRCASMKARTARSRSPPTPYASPLPPRRCGSAAAGQMARLSPKTIPRWVWATSLAQAHKTSPIRCCRLGACAAPSASRRASAFLARASARRCSTGAASGSFSGTAIRRSRMAPTRAPCTSRSRSGSACAAAAPMASSSIASGARSWMRGRRTTTG